jgi:hypothetical protein
MNKAEADDLIRGVDNFVTAFEQGATNDELIERFNLIFDGNFVPEKEAREILDFLRESREIKS